MIGIKCAACGRTFEVPDEQSGKNAKCPDCGAIVFVPTVGTRRIEPVEADTVETQTEKPKHLLSPLEMLLILVILGIMIVFVIFRVEPVVFVIRTPGMAERSSDFRAQ